MAIPRNLVYVFLLAIIFAFAGMIYVVYTEKDLSHFMNAASRDSLVDSNIVVHPLFSYLLASIGVVNQVPKETLESLTTKKFY